MENLTYNKVKEANKVIINNETEPTKSYVDETTRADLDGDIFETIEILLSLLTGDNIFQKIEKKSNKKGGEVFICKDSKGNYAEGKYLENGFLVFKNSKFNLKTTNSFIGCSAEKTRNFLISNKIVVQKNNYYILQKDYLFKSPSTAGTVVLGKQINGWLYWKNKEDKTLDEVYRKK